MATDQSRLAAETLLSTLPLPGDEAGWVHEIRAKARARLLETGAPARRDEYWKYTDPAPLTAVAEVVETDAAPEGALPLDGRLARFVNGRQRLDLSEDLAQAGLVASSLSDVLAQDISIMRTVFGVLEQAGQEKVARPLAILNTAVATEGLALQATGEVAVPIHIRYDQIGEGAALVRHVIRVESGADLTVLESGTASNTVMEVEVADGGSFHHIRLQDGPREANATHIFARLGAEAAFKTFTLTADGSLTRNEVVMEFTGDDASGHIAGGVLGQGTSHIDNTVFVTHAAERCESRQVFKNVLADKARGIFQGKIFVREGAQKTDGYQISQAVLLTDGAEFSAKPELEIYADDVACSHGSTTGALDQTSLFYLRSRGVSRVEAEAMLVSAFVEEAIGEIADDALADIMRDRVAGWMSGRR